jgi:hypothetical protein
MAAPAESELLSLAKDDAAEAIEIARRRDSPYPVVTIADGADHHAQTTGFHKRWWRARDENWPQGLRDAYDDAFTRELLTAEVAVVELRFDAAHGAWSNVGVVDLARWEPTFPFDRESTGWIQQDARSRVGWRPRSVLRKWFRRDKDKPDDQGSSGRDESK